MFNDSSLIGEGPTARSIKLDLPPFTLVGATTRAGSLTSPLRDRFGIIHRLEFYEVDALCTIISRSAELLGITIYPDAAEILAARCRGTPRIANALLRRVRDFAEIKGDGNIDIEIAKFALKKLNVDAYGLDDMDNKILTTIIEKFKGGPVGITTLATAVSEIAETIEEVYEPFLIQQGFIVRTPRGRAVTDFAYRHLGISRPDEQGGLFGA